MTKRKQGKRAAPPRGPLARALGGPVSAPLPGKVSPRPNRGSSLGATAKVGALGSALTAGKGFSAKPTPPGGALTGNTPKSLAPKGNNLRPKPGRGVNPLLALAGTPFHEAEDRLGKLSKRTLNQGL